MKKHKQVPLSKAVAFINKIAKSGRTITKTVYNGQPSEERYVWVEWIEPAEL